MTVIYDSIFDFLDITRFEILWQTNSSRLAYSLLYFISGDLLPKQKEEFENENTS